MKIAIEGNIGSGKSTILKSLSVLLAEENVPIFQEPVEEWHDLLSLFYSSPREYGFVLSMKVLMSFRKALEHPTCIIERSPISCRHVFSQMMYNEGNMTQHEWDLFKEYWDLLSWTPDVIIMIDTPASLCMTRIDTRGRGCESKISIEYVKRVEFQYSNMQKYSAVPFILIDGTRTEHEVLEDVLAELRKLKVIS